MPEIEFYGETFTVTDEPNEFALMEFADAAEDVDSNSLAALAAVLRLVKEAVVANPDVEGSTDESEWQRFRTLARKNKATSQTLMPVIFGLFEDATERPTGQPADSSVGPVATPLRSVSPPVEAALERLSGRPDMQAALLKTASA